MDATNDLAIVEIDDATFSGFPPIQYGFKRAVEDIGEDVFVLGYPLVTTMGEEVKLTTGVVSARSGFQGDKSQYQISAPVQPGNSGGPLFNGKAELIGIVSAKHTDADNVSYGVKLSYLLDLAIRQSVRVDTIRANTLSSKRLSEQCKTIIPCTVLVLADNESNQPAYATAGIDKGSSVRQEPSAGYPLHVNMPAIARRSTDAVEVYGIEVTSDGTIFYMTYTNAGSKAVEFSFSEKTYLVDKMTGERYHLIKANGCAIHPKKTLVQPGASLDFELFFPQLPSTIRQIDLCNPNTSNPIWLYGITIQ